MAIEIGNPQHRLFKEATPDEQVYLRKHPKSVIAMSLMNTNESYPMILTHEAAHALVGHQAKTHDMVAYEQANERASTEIVAQLTAQLVCRSWNAEMIAFSAPYLAYWFANQARSLAGREVDPAVWRVIATDIASSYTLLKKPSA
jgi:hypothetical protein